MATLSRDTAIIYTAINIDGAGVAYRPYEALEAFADVANRPIVVDAETNMGHGGAGGFVTTLSRSAKRRRSSRCVSSTAKMPRRFLLPPAISPGPFLTGGSYNGSESARAGCRREARSVFVRLQCGSNIAWYIIAALAIILVQALDRWFARHRARRRRAEAELRESQEFMELSTSAGELGLWARDLERGDLWTNVRLRSLFGFGQNDVLRFEDLLAAFIPRTGPESLLRSSTSSRLGSLLKGNFAW